MLVHSSTSLGEFNFGDEFIGSPKRPHRFNNPTTSAIFGEQELFQLKVYTGAKGQLYILCSNALLKTFVTNHDFLKTALHFVLGLQDWRKGLAS